MRNDNTLDYLIRSELRKRLQKIEDKMNQDVFTICGLIFPSLDVPIKNIIESLEDKKSSCTIILDTIGGVVEVVERIANIIRHHYKEVSFIVPYQAMSAGTVLTMSGDKIYMSYHSVLGPIDPQIRNPDKEKFMPALSYLDQFEELVEKSKEGKLTDIEFSLLEKIDFGELQTFKEAKALSIELLEKWLSTYKFKDWTETETSKTKVTPEMKKKES